MIRKTDRDIAHYSQNLKKNMILLSQKLDLEISEDIGPLIDNLLKQGLLENHEISLKG
jgi:hypothetical protein